MSIVFLAILYDILFSQLYDMLLNQKYLNTFLLKVRMENTRRNLIVPLPL